MDNDTQLVDAFYKDFYAHRAKNPPWIDPHTFPKKIVMPSVPHAGTTNIQAVSIVHSTVPIAPPAASPAAPRQAATARSDEMIGRWEKITSWPPKEESTVRQLVRVFMESKAMPNEMKNMVDAQLIGRQPLLCRSNRLGVVTILPFELMPDALYVTEENRNKTQAMVNENGIIYVDRPVDLRRFFPTNPTYQTQNVYNGSRSNYTVKDMHSLLFTITCFDDEWYIHSTRGAFRRQLSKPSVVKGMAGIKSVVFFLDNYPYPVKAKDSDDPQDPTKTAEPAMIQRPLHRTAIIRLVFTIVILVQEASKQTVNFSLYGPLDDKFRAGLSRRLPFERKKLARYERMAVQCELDERKWTEAQAERDGSQA